MHDHPLVGDWSNCDWRESEEEAWLDCPKYAEDIAAAYLMEERLLDLNQKFKPDILQKYSSELILLVGSYEFQLLHASAADRCKAALIAYLEM